MESNYRDGPTGHNKQREIIRTISANDVTLNGFVANRWERVSKKCHQEKELIALQSLFINHY